MTGPHDLLRAYCAPDAVEFRSADSDDGPDILAGHFAVWNQWTEINSRYEGHFLERIAPGAFDRSVEARTPKVLFDHGSDPMIGNKVIGDVQSLTNDRTGMAYTVALHDSSFVEDLKPGFRSGSYGASFRFSVPDGGDTWDTPTRATDHNPDRLPERTLTDVTVFEFGPVTFPAYEGATAGMRSLTDEFYAGLMSDPAELIRFMGRLTGSALPEKFLETLPQDLRDVTPEPDPTVDDLETVHAQIRRQWLAANFYA